MQLTQAEAEAGTATDKLMTPERTNDAIQALTTPPVLTEEFESSEQTITFGSNLSVSHGLTGIPKFVQVILKCKIAEGGYTIDDEVQGHTYAADSVSPSARDWGMHSAADTSNIGVVVGDNGILLIDPGSGDRFTITENSWRIIVRAWR